MKTMSLINAAITFANLFREHWIHLHKLGVCKTYPSTNYTATIQHAHSNIYIHESGTIDRPRQRPTFPTLPEHCAYPSRVEAGCVAVLLKPCTGRHEIMRIGKYLTKYTTLTNEQIKTIVGEYSQHKLVIRDDIVAAYQECSTDSCMSKAASSYSSHEHPMTVMERNGFQCATAVDQQGRVVARALVHPPTKRYPMVYGDYNALIPLLKKAGYKHQSFDGIELTVEREDQYIILPYIDGLRDPGRRDVYHSAYFDIVDDDTIVLLDDGPYAADETDGLTQCEELHTWYCDHCDEGMRDDDNRNETNIGEWVCDHCASQHYTFAYDEYNNRVYCYDEDVICACGEYYTSEEAAINDGCRIANDGEWYAEDELTYCNLRHEYFVTDEIEQPIIDTTDGQVIYSIDALDSLSVQNGKLTIGAPSIRDLINTMSLTNLQSILGPLPDCMYEDIATFYQEELAV